MQSWRRNSLYRGRRMWRKPMESGGKACVPKDTLRGWPGENCQGRAREARTRGHPWEAARSYHAR
eukprot:5576179-Pyramimonas_sp.AAC.1